MKYPLMALLMLLCTGLFLLAAGCTTGGKATAPAADLADNSSGKPGALTAPAGTEAMVALVKEAVAYARANGKPAALAEFSNRSGSFFRGELYIYAYDWDGTTIAHPVNPEKIGVNRLNETDANGGLFIRELRDAARNGGGFVRYTYVNPLHNNAVEAKIGYVEPVDGGWWLGSGIYGGPAGGGNTPGCVDAQPAGQGPAVCPVPASTTPTRAEEGKRMVTFTGADNGTTGTIGQKTRFTIELSENPTTGFVWNASLSPGLELQSSDFRQSPAAAGMVGVGGTRTWIIVAKDPGDQDFSASYRRSWEPVTGNETAYRITIRVVAA